MCDQVKHISLTGLQSAAKCCAKMESKEGSSLGLRPCHARNLNILNVKLPFKGRCHPLNTPMMYYTLRYSYQLPFRALKEAVAEGATVLTDFLLCPWRPRHLSPDAHHVCLWPSSSVGTYRSALYLDKVCPHMQWHF